MQINWKCVPFQELSLTELYDLMQLRQEVFIVEQDCPYLDADGTDQVSWHLMGFDEDSDMVAYTRLIPKDISYKNALSIGRVVNAKKVRGKGVGRLLMKESIAQLEQLFGQETIILSAQCYLLKFYQSLGFKPVGEEYLEDGIPHIKMKKTY